MKSLSNHVVLFLLTLTTAVAGPFGIGGDYDVIVKDNMTVNSTHIHGSTLVGGRLSLTGNMSEFGNQQPSGTGAGVTVNQTINLGTSGRINGDGILRVGALTSGQSINASQDLVGGGKTLYANQATVGATGIDVSAAFEGLIALSNALAGLTPTLSASSLTTGDAQNRQLNLSFNSSSPFNVLNLTGAQLRDFKNISVADPGQSKSGLIINVDLTGYAGGAFVQNRNGSGAGADLILWNFFGGSSLSLKNQFYGTILAPELSVTHTNNDLKGAVMAESFTKNYGQVHRHHYEGDVPEVHVPDSGSTAVLLMLSGFGLWAFQRGRRSL
ncbi:MAG TPA: VPDSG-CTERM sorting domain-containing protein [Opitutus sp.]|nr:VPDSG-CTERM sorting domain-containing protein [Opitutus sp.]